jgi:hypothetical protein
LHNRYKVDLDESGLIYSFTTRFNVKYNLILTVYQIAGVKSYSLSLYPDKEINVFDYWIKNTVIKVIADILAIDANVIFYVCDNMDGKEDERHIIFDYWYEKAKSTYSFIGKYDYCFDSEHGYKLNTSVLFNKENILSAYIIENFIKSFENQ